MKRSLNLLETKAEENKKLMDDMYEKKMIQDGKIVQMEKKLKEYKHHIQYLKKEKIEMERTFENKIKGFEEMVVHDPDDEEEGGKQVAKVEDEVEVKEDIYEFQAELTILNDKIESLE